MGSPPVKDVAAAAGVSLGTVSNVLNRPERVGPATRERVERAMAELGFVRNESARQLRAGTSRTLGLRDARRHQPVLHRRGPGHRVAAEDGGSPCHRATASGRAEREADPPHLPRGATGPGHPDHAGRPRSGLLDEIRAPGHPGRDRRPDPRSGQPLLGRGGRRARRPARDRAPGRPRSRAGRVHRRPVHHRSGRGTASTGAPRRWAEAGRPTHSSVHRPPTTHGRRGSRGGRAARRAVRAPPADRGVLRQRPARPRPAPAA